jgi:hypothetical protein
VAGFRMARERWVRPGMARDANSQGWAGQAAAVWAVHGLGEVWHGAEGLALESSPMLPGGRILGVVG